MKYPIEPSKFIIFVQLRLYRIIVLKSNQVKPPIISTTLINHPKDVMIVIKLLK